MSPAATIAGGTLVALFTGSALAGRARARAAAVLPPSDAPVDEAHVFLVRPGAYVDDATLRAASAYARERGLDVLDLVAPRVAAWRAHLLLRTADPRTYRRDRLAAGVSAGDAILVNLDVLERSRVDPAPASAAAFVAAARRLKHYAAARCDWALAPSLVSPGIALRDRRRMVRQIFGDTGAAFALAPLLAIAAVAALSPAWGLGALVAYQIRSVLMTFGSAIVPRDRLVQALFGLPIDVVSAVGPAAPPPSPPVDEGAIRAAYAALLEQGTARFFEPPRDDCPICGGARLKAHLVTGDYLQFKPGRFVLDRCEDCAHIFQNPRLSLEGLAFYYRDAYDGLGEERLDSLFRGLAGLYRSRVAAVTEIAKPRRWLDVGTGHAHFCCSAAEVLSETQFDGLDLNEGVLEAERRGWVRRGIRGLFPAVAPELADAPERYDVLSMHHYLEHTREPRAEIEAAAKVLPEGGLLLVELPDPECRFGRWLGERWVCWLQPQHLHFLNLENLERLLGESGFETVARYHGEAHQPVDFVAGALQTILRLAPPVDLPWRPPATAAVKVRNVFIWIALWPLLVLGGALDRAISPWTRRRGWSNAYRVVARRAADVASRSARVFEAAAMAPPVAPAVRDAPVT